MLFATLCPFLGAKAQLLLTLFALLASFLFGAFFARLRDPGVSRMQIRIGKVVELVQTHDGDVGCSYPVAIDRMARMLTVLEATDRARLPRRVVNVTSRNQLLATWSRRGHGRVPRTDLTGAMLRCDCNGETFERQVVPQLLVWSRSVAL